MSSSAPTALAADQRLRIQLARLLAIPAPDEACALLLGERRDSGGQWRLRRLWPCLNVWPQPAERSRRFAIDPREQLLAQRWGRQRGLEVLGHAHSHPRSAPEPSATDLSLCVTPALMLIQGPRGEQRIWWLAGDGAPPLPLPWTMED
ncbi:MAG: M67 family metallopeptidase [Synechococcaceae cyanobacterium]